MRQLTTNEILSLNKFLQMETNSLAMAKAGVNVIGDEQLRTLSQSGISAIEGRIKGLQQFIAENNVTTPANTSTTLVNTTLIAPANMNSTNNDNFTGGVV